MFGTLSTRERARLAAILHEAQYDMGREYTQVTEPPGLFSELAILENEVRRS